jgi:hypothetical protein
MGCCFSKPDPSISIVEQIPTALKDINIPKKKDEERSGNCKFLLNKYLLIF